MNSKFQNSKTESSTLQDKHMLSCTKCFNIFLHCKLFPSHVSNKCLAVRTLFIHSELQITRRTKITIYILSLISFYWIRFRAKHFFETRLLCATCHTFMTSLRLSAFYTSMRKSMHAKIIKPIVLKSFFESR